MANAYPKDRDDIDDEDAGEENRSGVGLNTTLPADPEKASGAFAGGPELGDANAKNEQRVQQTEKESRAFCAPDAQTDVSIDPHHRHPILPKSAKAQP